MGLTWKHPYRKAARKELLQKKKRLIYQWKFSTTALSQDNRTGSYKLELNLNYDNFT